MGRNIGTFRTKTRNKLSKNPREKGKLSLTQFFQTFNIGDRVHLTAEPSVHKGMYFPRFMGRVGIVSKKRKTCYEVKIKDGKKEKTLVCHPVHLKKAQ